MQEFLGISTVPSPDASSTESSSLCIEAIENVQLRLMHARVKQLQETQAQKEALIAELRDELASVKLDYKVAAREARYAIAQSTRLERELHLTFDRQDQLDRDLKDMIWEVKKLKGRGSDAMNSVRIVMNRVQENRLVNDKTRELQNRATEDVAKLRSEMGSTEESKELIPPKGDDVPDGRPFVQDLAPEEMPAEQDWQAFKRQRGRPTPSQASDGW